MRRRTSDDGDDGGGLDSLLDTMTNVVGILVMVLIATQLGVQDAVTRVTEVEAVDPAELEARKQQLTVSKEQFAAVLAALQNTDDNNDRGIDVQLDNLRRQINETQTKLQTEKATANEFAMKLDQDRRAEAEAKKKIAAVATEAKQKETLQKELNTALAREAQVKAVLDKTPAQQAPPAKVVTLPDPRPAPDGARQVTFLCVDNKVYPIAADDIRGAVRTQAEAIVKAKGLDGGPTVGVDQERFMKEFRKFNRTLQDDFWDIELYASGIYPRLKFTPKKTSGATEKEVLNPRSRFRKLLTRVDNTKYYARFIVLPDSYEVYLAVRAVVAKHGLLAGWDPQAQNYEYTTWLGGPTLFGPKPPPNPNPPPKTTKPQNVID